MSIEKDYILVKAPTWSSDEQVNNFIANNQEWIKKHLHLSKEKDFFFLGQTGWKFNFSNDTDFSYNIEDKQIFIQENLIHPNKEIFSKRIYQKHLNLYTKNFNELSIKHLGVKPKSWCVHSLASAWGQCNHLKIITLDPAMGALPLHLQTYIIWHELVHLIHLNHSKNFWSLCSTVYPDARKSDKELKSYCKNNFL